MKNKIKINIFLILLFLSTGIIIYKLNIEDDVYVVSESKETYKEKAVQEYNENEKNNEVSEESINKSNIEESINKSNIEKVITVHISGEIVNPGVVTIESNNRLSDAVDKLGGVTEDADLNRINLAIKLEDEKHYIIPKLVEDDNNLYDEKENNLQSENNTNLNKININKATIQDLDKLPGIGEATANKILNYREENGEFKSIEDIKNVNGIGIKKYEQIKNEISVN